MVPLVTAAFAPELQATVLDRRPLRYVDGPDAALDRPAHVRAGSSIAWAAGGLWVVQDDASFLARIDPLTADAVAFPLPPGHRGLRQFDDLRGNKPWKLDLEACVVVPDGGEEVLLAFGSGSSSRRERVMVARGLGSPAPELALVDAPALYAGMRDRKDFSGSELNLEGAVRIGGRVRLFQRGNGAPAGDLLPIDATCDLELASLLLYLAAPATTPPPVPEDIVCYALGQLDGVRLTFTDAAASPGAVLFLAAAEASPDAVHDGPVAGVVMGRIDGSSARWTPLRDLAGAPFIAKAEGLVRDPVDPSRAWLVLDLDDPLTPSELCQVRLTGPW